MPETLSRVMCAALSMLLLIPSGCCVVHGTRIATPTGEVLIEHIQIGDEVISQRDDGSPAIGRVTGKTMSRCRSYLKIQVAGQPHPLQVTGAHPVATREGWKRASRLSIGDLVQTATGPKRIDSIVVCSEPTRVYDLTVSPSANFIAEGVVVHNKSVPPPARPQDLHGVWIAESPHYWRRMYRLELSPDATGFLAVSGDDLYRIEHWSIDQHGYLRFTLRPSLRHDESVLRQIRGRAYPGSVILWIEDMPWKWRRNAEIRFEHEEAFLAELDDRRRQAAKLGERIHAARSQRPHSGGEAIPPLRPPSVPDGVRYETTVRERCAE